MNKTPPVLKPAPESLPDSPSISSAAKPRAVYPDDYPYIEMRGRPISGLGSTIDWMEAYVPPE